MNKQLRRSLWLAALGATATYGGYVIATWLRYGRPRKANTDEADAMLDRFMPDYDVVERHSTRVGAPTETTLATASEIDFDDSQLIRSIFKARDFLLRSQPGEGDLPRGLLAKTKALGWRVLAEIPGREVVMGAVTQPWKANVVFRGLSPEEFTSFCDPDFVKIAWTLRADPISATKSIFRTETRVLACGPAARSKFRKYWALLSPGIVLIRLAMLAPLRREAERRARES